MDNLPGTVARLLFLYVVTDNLEAMFCPGSLFSIGEEAWPCCWIPHSKHVFWPDLHLQVRGHEEPANALFLPKSLERADWRCLLQPFWVGYEGAFPLETAEVLKPGRIRSYPWHLDLPEDIFP